MNRFKNILLFGTVGLATLVGCKGAPPQEETSQQPTEAEPVIEESFEEGDTGSLTSEPEASTESEDKSHGDSD